MPLKLSPSLVCLLLTFLANTSLEAGVITARLSGDNRPSSPDNIFVDVSVDYGTNSDTAFWTVQVNSPDHPSGAFIGGFYFNLDTSLASVDNTSFNIATWTSGAAAIGGGNINFQHGVDGHNSPPYRSTHSTPLTFSTVLTSGVWTEAMFLGAASSASSDADIVPGQLGVHMQGLTNGESGFATGNFTNGDQSSHSTPEPTSAAIWCVVLLGLTGKRRRASAK